LRRVLVPLAVLLVGVGLFWWTRDDGGPLHDVPDDVRDCRRNLRAIYDGLVEYESRFDSTPSGSGVGFLAELVASGVWEASRSDQLTCPGPGALPVPPGTDFGATDTLDAGSSAYAGRNTLDHPLEKFPSGGPELQALVACDNATGSNHGGVLNVLYSDRSVKTLELERLIESGVLPDGATRIPIGPDSPIEELRTLTAD
jgi:hypothetical protein